MRYVLAALLLMGCAKRVDVDQQSIAYRINREDGATLIVQYPGGRRTLEELRDEFCMGQVCLMEVIRLHQRDLNKVK